MTGEYVAAVFCPFWLFPLKLDGFSCILLQDGGSLLGVKTGAPPSYIPVPQDGKEAALEAFTKGDPVIYGTNGVCTVADIRMQSPAPEQEARMYYILSQTAARGMTIAVPADNPALVARMRRPLTKEQIDTLLTEARGQAYPWIADRRARADAFHGTLANGMHRDLLLMLRCIYLQGQALQAAGKRLNVADEATFKAAEKLVTEEFSCSLGIEPAAVGAYIRDALEPPAP